MVKEVRANEGLIQACTCGKERTILFSSLALSAQSSRVIRLPACTVCNSVEFLLLNKGVTEHDLKVARVFAEVNVKSNA